MDKNLRAKLVSLLEDMAQKPEEIVVPTFGQSYPEPYVIWMLYQAGHVLSAENPVSSGVRISLSGFSYLENSSTPSVHG